MAGIVGICGSNVSQSIKDVQGATEATVYSSKTKSLIKSIDQHIALGKSYFTFEAQVNLSAQSEFVHVFIDGEIFHTPKSNTSRGFTEADLLLEAYKRGELSDFLKGTDGVFIAVIYDARKKEVKIISDRYGLKAFFICHQNRSLIFAPELKCFPHFRRFNLEFRKELIECFMDLGHLMGSDSWFRDVEFIEPSSIYSYNIASDKLSKNKYWKWSDNPRNTQVSIDDAAEKMSVLLRKAILARAEGNVRLGISLSGGLDSRAILASIYRDKPVLTYTFGLADSADVITAKRVAKVAKVENRHFPINVEHWLQYRFESVWKTDGLINMYHMHYPHIMPEVEKLIDINISGFSGDLVLGGSYLEKVYKMFFTKTFINQRITPEIAQVYFGRQHAKSDTRDSYFDFPSIDPYMIYNRCRRFVIMGIEEAAKLIPQRMPFMDTTLLEHAYSLPDEYRFNSKVYNKALMLLEPALFDKIPSASTGLTVSQRQTLFTQMQSQLDYYWQLVKVKVGGTVSFVDYHRWIKEPQTAELLTTLLDPKNALYPQLTNANFNELYLQPHLKGPRFYTQKILSALTIELWLQQVFNGSYKKA